MRHFPRYVNKLIDPQCATFKRVFPIISTYTGREAIYLILKYEYESHLRLCCRHVITGSGLIAPKYL